MINTSCKYRMMILLNFVKKYIPNYKFDALVSIFPISLLYP